jgi:hypothetical protein
MRWEVVRGVHKLVQLCAGVRKGERALRITDTDFPVLWSARSPAGVA